VSELINLEIKKKQLIQNIRDQILLLNIPDELEGVEGGLGGGGSQANKVVESAIKLINKKEWDILNQSSVLLQRIANLSGHFTIVSLPETHKLLHDFGHTVDELVLEIKGQIVSEVTGLDGDSNRELNDKETEVWRAFASVIFKADLILSFMASNTEGDFNETIERELEKLKDLEREAKKKWTIAKNKPGYPNVQDLVKEHLNYFGIKSDDPEIYCRYYLVLKESHYLLKPIPPPAPVVLGEGELAQNVARLIKKLDNLNVAQIMGSDDDDYLSADEIKNKFISISLKTAYEKVGLKKQWNLLGLLVGWEDLETRSHESDDDRPDSPIPQRNIEVDPELAQKNLELTQKNLELEAKIRELQAKIPSDLPEESARIRVAELELEVQKAQEFIDNWVEEVRDLTRETNEELNRHFDTTRDREWRTGRPISYWSTAFEYYFLESKKVIEENRVLRQELEEYKMMTGELPEKPDQDTIRKEVRKIDGLRKEIEKILKNLDPNKAIDETTFNKLIEIRDGVKNYDYTIIDSEPELSFAGVAKEELFEKLGILELIINNIQRRWEDLT
jgi:hypothetical protein